jgi:hypothetical protein
MANLSKTTFLAMFIIPTAALAQISVGDELGSSEAAVQAALEAQGYVITEIETEDGEIEVEATNGGQSFEFEVSPETGLVLAAYQQGDDDGEDDQDGSDADDDQERSD